MQASKRGLFIGCSGYPECDYTRPLHAATAEGDNILGKDPASGLDVKLLSGRFGPTCRSRDAGRQEGAEAAPRLVPKEIPLESATLELALKFLSLPREVGTTRHRLPIVANNGRFGPTCCTTASSSPSQDRQRVRDRPAACARSAGYGACPARRRFRRGAEEPGPAPDDGKDVTVRSGRYGRT